MSYPTPEERRNLAFAFIKGRQSITNPIFRESDFEGEDVEAQLVLQEFEDFLRVLPEMVKQDELSNTLKSYK